MIKRGIVLERKKNEAIIMTSSGEILRIRTSEIPIVGQEYEGKVVINKSWIKRTVMVAASFSLVFFIGLIDYYTPVKAMELDMNTRVRLEVNRWNKVVKIEPLDQKAEELTDKITIKNKDVNEAVLDIISEGKKENYIADGDKVKINVVKGKIDENTLKNTAASLGVDLVNKKSKIDKEDNKILEDKNSETNEDNNKKNSEVNTEKQKNQNTQEKQKIDDKKETVPATQNNPLKDEKKNNERGGSQKNNRINKENYNSEINIKDNDKTAKEFEKGKENRKQWNSKLD